MLWPKMTHQSQISGLLSGWVKIHKIHHVIFEITSQLFFKLWITLQCHERQLFCTFLAETLLMFQASDCSGQISPNLYFDRLLLLKVYKISAKKVQRSSVSRYGGVKQNLKKNRFVVLKMTRFWRILIQTLKSVKNLHFDWSLSCKKYNV